MIDLAQALTMYGMIVTSLFLATAITTWTMVATMGWVAVRGAVNEVHKMFVIAKHSVQTGLGGWKDQG